MKRKLSSNISQKSLKKETKNKILATDDEKSILELSIALSTNKHKGEKIGMVEKAETNDKILLVDDKESSEDLPPPIPAKSPILKAKGSN